MTSWLNSLHLQYGVSGGSEQINFRGTGENVWALLADLSEGRPCGSSALATGFCLSLISPGSLPSPLQQLRLPGLCCSQPVLHGGELTLTQVVTWLQARPQQQVTPFTGHLIPQSWDLTSMFLTVS